MKPRTIAIRAMVAAMLCAAGFVLVAVLVGRSSFESFDREVGSFVQRLESPALTSVMKGLSLMATGWPEVIVAMAAMAILYFGLGHRRELLLLVAAAAGAVLFNEALKQVFRRARPTVHRLAEAVGYSFPSGHTMAGFSLYAILIYLLWKHIPGAAGRVLMIAGGAIVIAGIGASRIYLGVHYPSDVIGGLLASGFWVFAVVAVYERWRAK